MELVDTLKHALADARDTFVTIQQRCEQRVAASPWMVASDIRELAEAGAIAAHRASQREIESPTSERVTVRIGHVSPGCRAYQERRGTTGSFDKDAQELADMLEISVRRASTLLHRMNTAQAAGSVVVALNYRQLARYTALRQLRLSFRFWKYPVVIQLEENRVDEKPEPIELRPGLRSRPL